MKAVCRSLHLLLVLHLRERDSVLECVRQAWARRRFCKPDSRLRPRSMQHLEKAVSAMQACAVHLCHSAPRRCRVTPEIAKASARGGAYGLWSAVTFAFPLTYAFTSRSLGTIVIATVLVTVHLVCIPIWQKKQKRFLCSTAWARDCGITPDRLRMFALRA